MKYVQLAANQWLWKETLIKCVTLTKKIHSQRLNDILKFVINPKHPILKVPNIHLNWWKTSRSRVTNILKKNIRICIFVDLYHVPIITEQFQHLRIIILSSKNSKFKVCSSFVNFQMAPVITGSEVYVWLRIKNDVPHRPYLHGLATSNFSLFGKLQRHIIGIDESINWKISNF